MESFLKQLFLILRCLVLAGMSCSSVYSQTLIAIDNDEVILCPAPDDTENPPSFNDSSCNTVTAAEIDPQNKAIWIKATIELPEDVLKNDQPYSIYIFAKTSSRVFFNGTYLGQNGTPSASANKEFAGRMDAKFYIPPTLLHKTSNELVLHLSSHHGFLQLQNPIHFIGLGSYAFFSNYIWEKSWISLIPLGALILGALYFAVSSLSPYQRQNNILFFLMAFFAASQLFAEMYRYLFSYSYPMHDVRLMLIVCLSLGFGACLWIYNVLKFMDKNRLVWIAIGVTLTLVSVIAVQGFDTKTAIAILTPAQLSIILIAYQLTKMQTKGLWGYLAVYLLLTISIILTLGSFHDSLFYYIITSVLGFLFIHQALELSKGQAKSKVEEQQIAKLQFKLDQNNQKQTPHKIKITSAGKVEFVATDSLVYCKAAADYTELFLVDQKQILYGGNLKELEKQLPTTFLRVHRSYVVNTDFIASFEKSSTTQQNTPSSSSFLLMTGGEQVPVSRRIMPTVRSALA
ncbi:MAG: DNA-binding LytR/AlgR family response regulator [Paraglaciecola sp.]|jgi:DNA-binding LytR/AlgR family response regulator